MSKTPYDTPPGQDNSLVADLGYGATLHKHRGAYFVRGGGFSTTMFDEIVKLINADQLVFFSVTGPPGKGKTYFAMRLMELLDKHFNITDTPAPPPKKDKSQMCFTRQHLSHLIGENTPLKHYQCVGVDESHFGLGARTWQKTIQQDVINLLVAVRSKRLIFFIIALSMNQIDKYLRNYVVNYQFTIETPGIATLYRRKFHKLSGDPLTKRMGLWYLPLPWVDDCENPDCIGCKYLYEDKNDEEIRCPNKRAHYERRKTEFLNMKSRGGELDEDGMTINRLPPTEITKKLQDFRYDIPRRGNTVFRGRLKGFIKDKLGLKVSMHTITDVAWRIEETKWWKEVINTVPA